MCPSWRQSLFLKLDTSDDIVGNLVIGIFVTQLSDIVLSYMLQQLLDVFMVAIKVNLKLRLCHIMATLFKSQHLMLTIGIA